MSNWRRDRTCRCGCGTRFPATTYNRQYVDKMHERVHRAEKERQRRAGTLPPARQSPERLAEEMLPMLKREAEVERRADAALARMNPRHVDLMLELLGVTAQ